MFNVVAVNEEQNTGSVWETLSANIQTHMDLGNPAGFVEDQVSSSPVKEESKLVVFHSLN